MSHQVVASVTPEHMLNRKVVTLHVAMLWVGGGSGYVQGPDVRGHNVGLYLVVVVVVLTLVVVLLLC